MNPAGLGMDLARGHLIRGQVATEYLLVVALLALMFALGEHSPIAQLRAAMADQYTRFTWALSQP